MKIGRNLLSEEWLGLHERFTEDGTKISVLEIPTTKIDHNLRSEEWCGLHQRFTAGDPPVQERGRCAKPSSPHPSWEVIWDEGHGNYYFWHAGSRVSRWAIVLNSCPVLKDQTIWECEKEALGFPREKRAGIFRKALFETADYKIRFGKTKIGSRAVNWKEGNVHTGEFLCPSLKKAFTTYQKLGKQDWYEKGKKGEMRVADEHERCVAITSKGRRCSKKMRGSVLGLPTNKQGLSWTSERCCTQHFNRFMKGEGGKTVYLDVNEWVKDKNGILFT